VFVSDLRRCGWPEGLIEVYLGLEGCVQP
jgi:hypothetical protein